MSRRLSDPRESQDQRLLIFLLLSVSLLMFWTTFNPPEPPVKADAAQQADAAPGADGNQPDADGKQLDDATPADGEAPQPPDADAPQEPPIEEGPQAEPQTVTIGSALAGSPYRMLMVLTNEGAAVERLVLSSNDVSEIDNHGASLGVWDYSDTDRGVRLNVVAPGTAAYEAGLRSGDVLQTGVREKGAVQFTDARTLRGWLAEGEPGQQVQLAKADGSSIAIELTRPALQLIRPERENIQLHDHDLPEGFTEVDSFLIRLAKVGELESSSAALQEANRRLTSDAWQVEQSGDGAVTFTMRLADLGLEVVKRFAIAEAPADKQAEQSGYHFDFRVEVRNLRDQPQEVAYQLQGPNGLPIEGFWYANKVGRKANGGGAWGAVGLRDVIVRYQDGPVSQMNPAKITEGDYETFGLQTPLAYAGVDAQYFSVMMIPQKQALEDVWFDYGDAILATPDIGPKVRDQLNNPTFTLTRKAVTLEPEGDAAAVADGFTVFAGPKRPDLLAMYAPAGREDYSLQSILYYGWFGPVAKLMLGLLHFFYGIVGNYGVAIILLTVLVRSLMYPLSRKQAMNMVKMQELKPEIDRIAEKYKDDMQKRSQAQQELFRKHNYNPMGGCLLMFIQLPIFLGLYRALAVDVELREASVFGHGVRFLSNLAAPDMFYDWSWLMPHSVNLGEGFFGLGPYFNLLPVITVVLFLVQQKMFMPPPTNEQAELQQKMMKYMMGFMGFLFFKVPSGLCLYFIASSLWGITERKLLPHPTPAAGAAPPPVTRPEPKKPASRPPQSRKKKKRKR